MHHHILQLQREPEGSGKTGAASLSLLTGLNKITKIISIKNSDLGKILFQNYEKITPITLCWNFRTSSYVI